MKRKINLQSTSLLRKSLPFFASPGLCLAIILNLVLLTKKSSAQTYLPPPAILTTAPAPGSYYNYSSITLNSTFNFTATANSSLNLYVTQQGCTLLTATPSQDQNYIMTSEPRIAGITTVGALANRTNCDVMQTVQYFDGLGRAIQTVQVKASPTSRDIVQPMAYDDFGREVKKYLPYTATAANSNGSFKTTAISDQASFFNNPSGTTWSAPGVVTIPVSNGITPSFSLSNYERSPEDRVLEQGASGADWQPINGSSAGHTVKVDKLWNNIVALSDTANSRWVARYTVTINSDQSRTLSLSSGIAGRYDANQLSVTISKDENYKNFRGGTIEKYQDKEGRILLKRTFNYNPGGSPALQIMSTYYVYDDLGNLAFVLTPGANPDAGITSASDQTKLNNLCYQYRYDSRNRLTQKKIPGQGWQYIVYNKLDQQVLTQDAKQRLSNQWTAIKYDPLGRVIIVGLWNAGSVIALNILRDSIYNKGQWDVRNYADNVTGYNIYSFPTLNKILSINYFDDYTNIPGLSSKPYLTAPLNTIFKPKGLATVGKTIVLNTLNNSNPDTLWSVNYYDKEGRNVKAYKQHYLGGTASYSKYNYEDINNTFSFVSELTSSTMIHYKRNAGGTDKVLAITINKSWYYDHAGRKLSSWQQLTNSTLAADSKVLLSKMEYNEIGQPWKKRLHSTDSAVYKQTITYSYNERGWKQASTAELFQEYLQYNNSNVNGISPTPRYNGNITSQSWGTELQPSTKSFVYSYDQLNRLKEGNSTSNNNENSISYDLMGNITALKRFKNNVLIDDLKYYYTSGGNNTNQLQSIDDLTSSDVGLKHGLNQAYSYDDNGNLKLDASKSISNINYNLLNLPETIPDKDITYTYDASGQKLRRVIGTLTTDYIDGIQYDGSSPVMSFVQTEEGRAFPTGGSTYNYEYNLTDHLGNSRVSFDTGTGVARQVQTNDYLPFGSEMPGAIYTSPPNNYLYNSKELQSGIGMYDFGARFYDPIVARWNSIDQLSEKYFNYSPYNYVANNPINIIDPDGRDITPVEGGVLFDNNNTNDATNAFLVLTGKSKNVYIHVAEKKETRDQENAEWAKPSYGTWSFFAVKNLNVALTVLEVFPDKSIDNLAIQTHGGQDSEEAFIKTDELSSPIQGVSTIWESTIAKYNAGTDDPRVSNLKKISDKVKDNGYFILSACQSGEGRFGEILGVELQRLTGQRLNILLPGGLCWATFKPYKGYGRIINIVETFQIVNNKGWLLIPPNGNYYRVKEVHLIPFKNAELPIIVIK